MYMVIHRCITLFIFCKYRFLMPSLLTTLSFYFPYNTGTNTSTTELYLTGALPSAATFPSPAALSTYQHIGSYPSRSYTTNSSLAAPDPVFSTSTNGLFSPHDALLHLKPSQTVLPAALAFNHLPSQTWGTTLPVQSSTYRSAQESAPHLLLPSNLSTSHGSTQPYGATVLSSSLERALQRECSVIKHHQRPSSSISASEQMPSSEHSLQGFFGTGGELDGSYQQDPNSQNTVSSNSTEPESSQEVSGASQPKTDPVTQAYSSTSLSAAEDSSTKAAAHLPVGEEGLPHSQDRTRDSPEHYPQVLKQNPVLANQQPVQLSSLLSNSLSQNYMTPHTQSPPAHATSDKLFPLYKTLPPLSIQSENAASVTLIYSSSPRLNQGEELHYGAQVQGLCQGNLAENFPSSHSQGLSNVSFTAQSQVSATQSQSYITGHSLNQTLPSYPPTCLQSLPTSNSSQDYSLIQASTGGKLHDTPSQQPHKYVLSASLPAYSSTAQALQTNENLIRDAKHKLQELPVQDATAAASNMSVHNNVIYVVSKMDEHHKTQSVIRSNSDEQLIGVGHMNVALTKEEQQIQLSSTTDQESTAMNMTNSNEMLPSLVPLSPEQLKQHPLHLKTLEPHQHTHQGSQSQAQAPSAHTQFITVPGSQVLLEHNHMILLQQPLAHNGDQASKVASVQSIPPVQDVGPVRYLPMDRDLQDSVPTSGCPTSSKHHYGPQPNQQPNDAKNNFSLNSICFPDSILLGDDRNILSNVDDILAATVAACGVTPQDFAKATSSAEADMVMPNPVDSKSHFHTVDLRHMSPSFSSSQHLGMTNANSHSIAPNGTQMSSDCHGQSLNHSNSSDLDTNGDGGSAENDFHLAGQAYDPSGFPNRVKAHAKGLKTEDNPTESLCGEDFSKKKARSKPAGPEEDTGQTRSSKRCGQTKRQNSRGSDVGSPSSSHSAYDGCLQQERVRQKIREVEEKQPEVKTGFIGSFLDFIKFGPKQQYSPSPTRIFSRQKKPCTVSKALLCPLPAVPSKLQTLPPPVLSQEPQGVSCRQKRLEEDLQKNLETLPSFSSDEEENTGRNQALRNSISSALSALDDSSDHKNKTGNEAHLNSGSSDVSGTDLKSKMNSWFEGWCVVMYTPEICFPFVSNASPDNQLPVSLLKPEQLPTVLNPVTKGCLPQIATPPQASNLVPEETALKDEPKDNVPVQLAVRLNTVAIEGLTDEELSDSGGEGMYRERDEFVVRNEDIDILKVCTP